MPRDKKNTHSEEKVLTQRHLDILFGDNVQLWTFVGVDAIPIASSGQRTGSVKISIGVLAHRQHLYASLEIGKNRPIHITDPSQFAILKELVNHPKTEQLIKDLAQENDERLRKLLNKGTA